MAGVLAVGLLGLTLSGCGTSSIPSAASTPGADTGAAASSPQPATALGRTQAQFQALAQTLKPVDLESLPMPKAPKGYTTFEENSLGHYAIDLAERSCALGLSSMSPRAAARYVVADLPAGTRNSILKSITNKQGRITDSTELGLVDRFKTTPATAPVIVAARWTSGLGTGNVNGDLALTLTTYALAEVSTPTGPGPLLIKRVFELDTADPQGNPSTGWWPGWKIHPSDFWGMDNEAFTHQSLLAPASSAGIVEAVTRELKKLTRHT